MKKVISWALIILTVGIVGAALIRDLRPLRATQRPEWHPGVSTERPLQPGRQDGP